MSAVLLLHICLCWFMMGVIWIIQLVHYPLFALVGSVGYRDYQDAHMRKITRVVLPAMVGELATAAWCLYEISGMSFTAFRQNNIALLLGLNFLLLAIIWLSTMALQVPIHAKLRRGFEKRSHKMLVRTNWIRTSIWTVRALILLALAAYMTT